MATVWDYTEATPDNLRPVCDLWAWGLNYHGGDPSNPWPLFLDLIGWSADHLGQNLTERVPEGLGWIEADHLADALRVWANDPHAVGAWVSGLFEIDRGDD